MPYEIRKQGDKHCVFNKDTGENHGCSSSHEMAIKHMRALYANAGDKQKALGPICDCDGCAEIAKEYEIIEEPTMASSIASTVVDSIKGWFQPAAKPAMLTLTKQADGRTRVLLRVSNIFKDRHGEIITEAAHKEYEAYVNESKAYPEFWLWHTPGSRWGQADLVSYDDGFLTMSGLIDQGKEYIAEALVAQSEKVGVSHGFKALSVQGKGYIDWYRTFEASPLPIDQAANVWTGMMLAKEWEMGLADKQKKFFETIGIPETIVQGWDSDSKQLSEKLKASGIEFKDMESLFKDTEPEPAPPGPQPQPAPPPAPTPSDTTADPVLAELRKLNERFEGLESKQKELESKVKDSVADTMAAAVIPGAPAGYVASKQGEAPSDSESQANKQWEEELTSLILGAK